MCAPLMTSRAVNRASSRGSGRSRSRRSGILRWARWLGPLPCALALLGVYLTQPLLRVERRLPTARADPERLRRQVEVLSRDTVPRDSEHVINLDRAAEYIRGQFVAAGITEVRYQPFEVAGRSYRNVIARLG